MNIIIIIIKVFNHYHCIDTEFMFLLTRSWKCHIMLNNELLPNAKLNSRAVAIELLRTHSCIKQLLLQGSPRVLCTRFISARACQLRDIYLWGGKPYTVAVVCPSAQLQIGAPCLFYLAIVHFFRIVKKIHVHLDFRNELKKLSSRRMFCGFMYISARFSGAPETKNSCACCWSRDNIPTS